MSLEIYYAIASVAVACVILFVRYFKQAKRARALVAEQRELISDLLDCQKIEHNNLAAQLKVAPTELPDAKYLLKYLEVTARLREAETKLLFLEAEADKLGLPI